MNSFTAWFEHRTLIKLQHSWPSTAQARPVDFQRLPYELQYVILDEVVRDLIGRQYRSSVPIIAGLKGTSARSSDPFSSYESEHYTYASTYPQRVSARPRSVHSKVTLLCMELHNAMNLRLHKETLKFEFRRDKVFLCWCVHAALCNVELVRNLNPMQDLIVALNTRVRHLDAELAQVFRLSDERDSAWTNSNYYSRDSVCPNNVSSDLCLCPNCLQSRVSAMSMENSLDEKPPTWRAVFGEKW